MPTPDQIADYLRKASDAYYNTGKTIMSDAEFDKLRDHLKSVDPNHSFFTEVGAPISEHRDEVKLLIHMGSQNKAKTIDEMKEWFNKYNNPEVIISDKADGSSVEVVYKNGKLWRASTRGDGVTGLDITRNAKLWRGLPKQIDIKKQVVVRGEAQLSISNWREHYSSTANPRNAGNGIIVCDTDYSRNEHITFRAFDISHPEVSFEKQSHKFTVLKDLGFNTVRWFYAKTWEDLCKCREHYEKERSELEFEIDGMIVALEDLSEQEKAGYSDGGTRPKGQIAFKFNAETAETEVIDIDLTLGHTGKVVPTAVLKPIQLAGTTVKHILLNNFQYIKDLGLNIGDTIEVEKGGDIIPHCRQVIKKGPNQGYYLPPDNWKGYPIVRDGRDYKVTDEDCPDLNFQRIKNWVKKLSIKYLGDNALMSLIDSGMVKEIPDLYSLDANEVSKLPVGNGVIGENASKIIKEIDKTRELTIDRFIGSLSIKHLGRSRAALLIDKGFDNIDYYLNADASNFVGMPCSDTGTYGRDVAVEIYESLKKRRQIIGKLKNIIKIDGPEEKMMTAEGKLSGMLFCFTGCRPNDALKQSMEDEGAVIKSSVTKDLTHLVCKDKNSTSNKAKKARERGVEVIGLEDLEEMMQL